MESELNCRLIASRRTRAVVIDASLQNLHRDLDVYAWACSRCSGCSGHLAESLGRALGTSNTCKTVFP